MKWFTTIGLIAAVALGLGWYVLTNDQPVERQDGPMSNQVSIDAPVAARSPAVDGRRIRPTLEHAPDSEGSRLGRNESPRVRKEREEYRRRFEEFVDAAKLSEAQERQVRQILSDAQLNMEIRRKDHGDAIIDGEKAPVSPREFVENFSQEVDEELQTVLTAEQFEHYTKSVGATFYFLQLRPFEVALEDTGLKQ